MDDKLNLYILGAGASKPDRMPLTNEIIKLALYNFGGAINKDGSLGYWDKEIYINLKCLFKLFDFFYKTDFSRQLEERVSVPYHCFCQDVISTSMIEGFYTKLYNLKTGRENYNLNLSQEETSKLWETALRLFFHPLCFEAVNSLARYYTRFIDNVLQARTKHCIISLNYDLMLEKAYYLKLQNNNWQLPNNLLWTYGIDFVDVRDSDFYKFPKERDANIFYFKLHGSLNFGYCPVDKKLTLYSFYADHQLYDNFFKKKYLCHDGAHASSPLLVPPIEKKEIDKNFPALGLLWDKTYDLVSKAQELHIIGYSLPDGDEEVRKLIKKIPLKQIQKVIIVNPDKKVENNLRLDILKEYNGQIIVYNNFEEYLNNFKTMQIS